MFLPDEVDRFLLPKVATPAFSWPQQNMFFSESLCSAFPIATHTLVCGEGRHHLGAQERSVYRWRLVFATVIAGKLISSQPDIIRAEPYETQVEPFLSSGAGTRRNEVTDEKQCDRTRGWTFCEVGDARCGRNAS